MDTPKLPGFNGQKSASGKKTLRDLVGEHDAPTPAGNSFLTPRSGGNGSGLRLAFPRQDQLAGFVAAHYRTLFATLDGLDDLKLIAGGPLQTKRLYANGRSAAPDLLFETPDGEIVVIALHRDPPKDVRLNLGTELTVIEALHGKARGIIITPSITGEISDRIRAYVNEIKANYQVDWVRYSINMEIDTQ